MKFRNASFLANCIKSNGLVKIFIDKIFCLDHPFSQVDVCIQFCRKRYYLLVIIGHVTEAKLNRVLLKTRSIPIHHSPKESSDTIAHSLLVMHNQFFAVHRCCCAYLNNVHSIRERIRLDLNNSLGTCMGNS